MATGETPRSEVKCRNCHVTIGEVDADPGKIDCPQSNNWEHDFPGYKRHVILESVYKTK